MNNISSTHGRVEISLVETAIRNLNEARQRKCEKLREEKRKQLKQPYKYGFLWLKTRVRWDEEVEELIKKMEKEYDIFESQYWNIAHWLDYKHPHYKASKLSSLISLVKESGGSFIQLDVSDAKLVNDWQESGDLA